MDTLLPPIKFVTAPSPEIGRQLSEEILRTAPQNIGGLAILKIIIDQKGWKISRNPTFSAESKMQALLVPLLRGGFSVVLNTSSLPNSPEEAERQETFLIGHEIAHSFFYKDAPGTIPHRIGSKQTSQDEEAFCDEFGQAFVT